MDRGEGRQVIPLTYGLLPFCAEEKKLRSSTINARIYTAASTPALRPEFKKRRRAIPMTDY